MAEPGPSATDQVIMLIRHGEKPPHSGRPHGVSVDGGHDSHSLTVQGWIRAGALAGLFAPAHGEPRAPLCRPDSVYAAAHRGSHSKRPAQTVTPLAARLGSAVDTRFVNGEERQLARELHHHPGVTLVCWHHDGLCAILDHLGAVSPAPPPHWPDDRFDVVWTCTRRGTRWQFAQVPQQLLPGDRSHPIAG